MLNGFWASNFKTSQMCKWRFSSDTQTGLPRKLSRWYSGALKQRNKTQRNKKYYVYTVKYMKSSSPDDSSLMQHAIIPTLPPSFPSPRVPSLHLILLLFKNRSLLSLLVSRFPSRRWLGNWSHSSMGCVTDCSFNPPPVGMGFFPTVRVGVILLL